MSVYCMCMLYVQFHVSACLYVYIPMSQSSSSSHYSNRCFLSHTPSLAASLISFGDKLVAVHNKICYLSNYVPYIDDYRRTTTTTATTTHTVTPSNPPPPWLRLKLFCSLWLRNLSLLCIVIARVRSL